MNEQGSDQIQSAESETLDESLKSFVQQQELFFDEYTFTLFRTFQNAALVDMWSDIIVLSGDTSLKRSLRFLETLNDYLHTKKPPKSSLTSLEVKASSGFVTEARTELALKFYSAYVVIYSNVLGAGEGNIYVTWRAYIRRRLDGFKFLLHLLLGLAWGVGTVLFQESLKPPAINPVFQLQIFLPQLLTVLAAIALIFLLSFFFGLLFKGDWLKFLRLPLNEFDVDRMLVLTHLAEDSIKVATDAIGVDTAQLQAKEPYFKTRQRSRL